MIWVQWDSYLVRSDFNNNLFGHTDSVNDLIFLGNDKLASCSSDKTIKIWDMNKKQSIFTNTEHTGAVLSLCSLNNSDFASSSQDKTIKIWNTNLFGFVDTIS